MVFNLYPLSRNRKKSPPPTAPSANASQGMLSRVAADAGAGWGGNAPLVCQKQINPRFLWNRLSGCSLEQGFIISVILLPSLDPPPDTRAARAFSCFFMILVCVCVGYDHPLIMNKEEEGNQKEKGSMYVNQGKTGLKHPGCSYVKAETTCSGSSLSCVSQAPQ
ncbi:hypothetical protein J2T61_000978 [Methanocalculus sp. AMF5]|nr:hypothetical protein [Methanocalculus sp. AMF5]